MAASAAAIMPTDCSAMVATVIRLRRFLGMISETYAPLVGKSIPMPSRNCPARINRSRSDNRHVCEESALATEFVRRDAAERSAHDGPKDEGRAYQADHDRTDCEIPVSSGSAIPSKTTENPSRNVPPLASSQ